MCIYANIIFINKKTKIPHQEVNSKPFNIIKENWTSLIPLILLILVVIFRTTTIAGIHFDLVPETLGRVMISENLDLYTALSQISILRGVSNGIVLSIIFVTIGSMIGKEVDPIKSMIMMIPMCLLMIIIGMVLLYI